LENYNHLIKI